MHIYILRMHAFVLHNKTFSKTLTILLEGIQKTSMTKLQEKLPLVILTCWSLNIVRDLGPQGQKGSRIVKLDIASEKTMRVDNKRCKRRLPKWRKWWSAWQKKKGLLMIPIFWEPTSWKGDIVPSIEPNSDNPCEQGKLRKDPFGRSHHVDMQQRCSLIDKKLKEIEGVDDLESVES